jgi:hypothetical protein
MANGLEPRLTVTSMAVLGRVVSDIGTLWAEITPRSYSEL